MKNIVWVVVLIGGFVAYTYFGQIQDEVIDFNDNVIDLLEYDNNSFETYLDYMNRYYASETIDVEQMSVALTTLQTEHQTTLEKANQVAIPEYDTCSAFHKAFMDYMENGTNIITKYAEIVNYIEAHNPGVEADFDEVDIALSPLLETDDTLFKEITANQENMAGKFKFKLEE